jgi:hypothetical protein
MFRLVIFMGHAGKGFGPVGAALGALTIAAAGFLTGRKTKKKRK